MKDNWFYKKEGWNQTGSRMKIHCDNCDQLKEGVEYRRFLGQYLCGKCYQILKPKEVIARLKDPIRTGMALAFGFFLMGILLTFIGWLFVGASCAALMSRF